MEEFRASGRVRASDGKLIPIDARTVCVHADSPGALRIARLLATLFREDRGELGSEAAS
jgi:lactam utilization protein B